MLCAVLSANERPEAIVKAISYGACGYLVKPVQTNDLNIMWRQVISRRTPDPWSFCSIIGNGAAEKAQPTGGAAGGEQDGASSTKYEWTESHEHDGDDHDANEEIVSPDPSTRKKPRTTWTNELHDKFVGAVSQIGMKSKRTRSHFSWLTILTKTKHAILALLSLVYIKTFWLCECVYAGAVPSKILAAMNVDNVSRESVGSHLQVYFLRLVYTFSVNNRQCIDASS